MCSRLYLSTERGQLVIGHVPAFGFRRLDNQPQADSSVNRTRRRLPDLRNVVYGVRHHQQLAPGLVDHLLQRLRRPPQRQGALRSRLDHLDRLYTPGVGNCLRGCLERQRDASRCDRRHLGAPPVDIWPTAPR